MASKRSPSNGQLPLSLSDGEEDRPSLPARLSLPLAADGHAPFDDEAYFFEPWWPGAHATLEKEGDRLLLGTEHLADPLLAFPELAQLASRIRADGVIIEGTLLALDAGGRPDPRLLRRRLGGGAGDEVAEGAFVATDMPYLDGRPLTRLPFVERRRRLAAAFDDSDHGVLSRGIVGEGRMLGRAVAALGLTAISARRLDARWKGGPAGDAWLRLPVVEPRTVETTPFLVLLERLPLGD
jgi:bifunctional non-homologous end joining protein LigD